MANKILIMENLNDHFDILESQVRPFVIEWTTTQLTQENCEQVNDLVGSILSKLNMFRLTVDTDLQALRQQVP